jgi:hypothetical protein
MRRAPALALACAFALATAAGANAQPATPGAGGTATAEITRYDVAQLLQAVDLATKSPKIRIEIVTKPAAEMPSFDLIFWYAGITNEGDKKIARVWKNASLAARPSIEGNDRLEDARMLAVMDYGFAGEKWKALYDSVAQADALLGQSTTDRYQNRHALIKTIQDFIADAQHRPHS